MREAVVVGIGREERGDDGIGPRLIDRLSDIGAPADLMRLRPDPGDLRRAFSGRRVALLIDACRSGAAPGTVLEFDLHEASPETSRRAQHGMALIDAVDLVRQLYGLPPECRLFAVEAAGLGHGEALSPAVAKALDPLAKTILRRIESLRCRA
jgi:hydrogenase maturation protease